ncbi:hypothetical protein GQ457_10G020160 [Hibiscus cannabinus]
MRGDNEPEWLASYSGSARSKLDSSEFDSGSCSARDLNKSSRANPNSARKAREQAQNNHIHIIHEYRAEPTLARARLVITPSWDMR